MAHRDDVKKLLFDRLFCCVCLENSEILFKFAADVVISIDNNTRKTNLTLLLQDLLGRNILNTTVTDYICGPCKDIVTNFFNFKIKLLKNAESFMHYASQLDTKMDELFDYCINNSDIQANTLIVLDEPPNYLQKLNENNKIKVEVGVKYLKDVKCYICDCCNRAYDTRGGIVRHLNASQNKNPRKQPNSINRIKRSYKVKTSKAYSGCCSKIACPHLKYREDYRRQRQMEQPFVRCMDCKFTCRTFRTLVSHVNEVHLDIKHVCSLCGFVTYNWEQFKAHNRKCGKLECPFCHLLFTDKDNSEEHMKLCKSMNGKFNCEHCEITCSTKMKLLKHLKVHVGTFSCDECGNTYLSPSYLKRHHRKAHNINNYRSDWYICSVCHINCMGPKALKAHLLTHNKNEKHLCKLCEEEFDTRTEYIAHLKHKRHKKGVDSNILMAHRRMFLKCSICDLDCSNYKKLNRHILTHDPDEKHKCKPCGEEFDTRLLYLRHTSTNSHLKICHPNEEGVFRCPHCEFITIFENKLRQHIVRLHEKPKNVTLYTCQFCQKTFTARWLYKDHVKRHIINRKNLGRRPAGISSKVCDICGKRVNSSMAMVKHKRLHTGERPYPCDLCDMAFISASHRDAHVMRKHTEKSVECPICFKLFHAIGNARGHVRKAHWKRKEPFDYKKLPDLNEGVIELFRDRRLLM